MKNIPKMRLILSMILCILVVYIMPSIADAMFDDLSVASLNDAVASRTMVVNENLRGLLQFVPFLVGGGCIFWIANGWKNNVNRAEQQLQAV